MTSEQIKELEDKLWEAADKLRVDSGLKASEYATPILGLIILRFASIKYNKVKLEIEALIKAQQNKRLQRQPHEIAIEKCGFYFLISQTTTRKSFAERLQEIIDRYNAGGAITEDYFNDLVSFMEKLREEEERHIREGLTEAELELFDLLKKENMTKEEEQKVKLAAKKLLKRLTEEKPTVLINDWYKDTQTKLQVQSVIKKVLDDNLPKSYDRTLYSNKCDIIIDHFYAAAIEGVGKAVA
jgi:type I restriction-modification system DNA methylase subunit